MTTPVAGMELTIHGRSLKLVHIQEQERLVFTPKSGKGIPGGTFARGELIFWRGERYRVEGSDWDYVALTRTRPEGANDPVEGR